MRKTIACLLSFLLLLGGLTACSQQTETSGGPAATATRPGEALPTDEAGEPLPEETGGTGDADSTGTGASGGSGTTNTPGVSGSKATNKGGSATKKAPDGGKATSKATVKRTAAPTAAKDPTAGINFGGKTFTLYTTTTESIFNQKKGISQYLDAAANRLSALASKMNCKFDVKMKAVQDMRTTAFNMINSGEKFADLAQIPIHQSGGWMVSALCTNLRDVSTVDLTRDYMNSGDCIEAYTFGDGTYFVGAPELYVGSAMGYFFNKRILKECKLENPYDLVKTNKWTISKLREMAKAATKDLDGKPGLSKADQYGILQIGYSADATEALLAAVGAQMLKTDSKHNLVYNMDSKEVIDAINLANALWVKDGTTHGTTSGTQESTDLFISGHGLFLGGNGARARAIMDMDDDFGYVPFPRGDNMKQIRSAVGWNSTCLMIPAGLKGKDLEDTGKLLQALCYSSQDVADKAIKEFKTRYFRDKESSEMLNLSLTSQKLAKATTIGSSSAGWSIHEGTYRILYQCVPGNETPQSMIEKFKKPTVTALNEMMEKLRKLQG